MRPFASQIQSSRFLMHSLMRSGPYVHLLSDLGNDANSSGFSGMRPARSLLDPGPSTST